MTQNMDRRNFIKWGSFLTVSVAGATLAGCGSGDDGLAQKTPPGTDPAPDKDPVAEPARYQFPQGIASGDPRPDSMILWTRVLGESSGAFPVTIELALDEAFTQPIALSNPTSVAHPEWDYTVRHKVTGLAPWTTYYYRFTAGRSTSPVGRTKTAPQASASVDELRFAFISCQDWSVNHWAGFTALLDEDLDFIVHLGDYIYETVNAGFQTGHVEHAHGPLSLPDGSLRADGASFATTLADYRSLYRSYRSDARLQALHARFPMIAIWDDHEFSDDCWQDRPTYAVGDDATPSTQRRRSASQAWFEFMPADVQLDTLNPSFENIQIYRAFEFGTLATLVMTDERLYRADHVVAETEIQSEVGSRYFVPKALIAYKEAEKMAAAQGALTPVSVLGDAQRNWWKAQMQNSPATWKLWGNEVSLLRMQFDGTAAVAALMGQALVSQLPLLQPMLPALGPALLADLAAADKTGPIARTPFTQVQSVLSFLDAPTQQGIVAGLSAQLPPSVLLNQYLLNADQWDGFNAERKDLMAHLQKYGIENVVALTGDIHAFFAGSVMADYDANVRSPVMVDLVTAGISSNSFFSYFKSVVDSNAAFKAAAPLIYTEKDGVIDNVFNRTLTQFNGEWMKYVDTDAQGYAVVSLTKERLACTFKKLKGLEGVQAPASPVIAQEQVLHVWAGQPFVVPQASH